jgi:hypothetical protein
LIWNKTFCLEQDIKLLFTYQKRLPASRIINLLPHISKDPDYCIEYIKGKNGIVEAWYCSHFEGRINRASIAQPWDGCNFLGTTEMYFNFTRPVGLLYNAVKASTRR